MVLLFCFLLGCDDCETQSHCQKKGALFKNPDAHFYSLLNQLYLLRLTVPSLLFLINCCLALLLFRLMKLMNCLILISHLKAGLVLQKIQRVVFKLLVKSAEMGLNFSSKFQTCCLVCCLVCCLLSCFMRISLRLLSIVCARV